MTHLPTIAITRRELISFFLWTETVGSNRSSFTCSSGLGRISAQEFVFGAYCPGISMKDEPPPYDPPTPSNLAALATEIAAFLAAFDAAAAEDDVVD